MKPEKNRKLSAEELDSRKAKKPEKPVTPLNTGAEKVTKLASMKALIASVGASTFGTVNTHTGTIWSRLMLAAHIRDALDLRLGGIEKLHSSMANCRPNDNTSANLGFLTYFPHEPSGSAWGFDLIGASRVASKWTLNKSKFVEVTACPCGHIPQFKANSKRAENDSEYLLLNYFDAEFKHDAELKGHVALFTERLPCASCESVITQFLKHYSQLQMHIAYFVESSSDQERCRASVIARTLEEIRPGSVLTQFVPKTKGNSPAKDLDDFDWVQKH